MDDKKLTWLIFLLSYVLWSSFGLCTAALANEGWLHYAGHYKEGLWVRRNTTEDTAVGIERLPWINAVCSLLIIGIVFIWSSAFGLNIVTGCWKKFGFKWLRFASYCSILGALSQVIACSIYTSEVQNGYLGSGVAPDASSDDASLVAYGVGFGLAWGGAAMGVIGCAMFLTTVGKVTEEDFNSVAESTYPL